MTLNNYQWSNKRGQCKRVRGKFYVDALTLLTTKMDAMTQRLDRLNVSSVDASASSLTFDRCGSSNHLTVPCQIGKPFAQSSSEPIAYVNNFQRRTNHAPYSNSYNLVGINT